MTFIPNSEWDKYSQIINGFIESDSGLQSFIWLKSSSIPTLPFGEDSGPIYLKYELKGLFQYNYIRAWPYNKETISGSSPNNNIALYITKKYLSDNNLLDEYGYWKFNPVADRFIVNGKAYKPSGDTQVSQTNNNPLLFFVILDVLDDTESKELLLTYNN